MNFLLTWYNTPFLISLGLSLLFAVFQIVGGFGDSDADADGDVEVDGDADFFGDALSILGVGKVPLMFVLVGFLGVFGLSGLLFNVLINQFIATYNSLFLLIAIVASVVLAFFLTGRISNGFARLTPDNTQAVGFEQLVGRVGVVSSASVSPTYRRVMVRDHHGGTHTVYAILTDGEPIPERSEVALVSYDQARRCFIVRAMGRG